MATVKKSLDLFNELQTQLEEEEKSCFRIRDAEVEIKTFIKTQDQEVSKPKLSVSIFDRSRNDKAKYEILEQVLNYIITHVPYSSNFFSKQRK